MMHSYSSLLHLATLSDFSLTHWSGHIWVKILLLSVSFVWYGESTEFLHIHCTFAHLLTVYQFTLLPGTRGGCLFHWQVCQQWVSTFSNLISSHLNNRRKKYLNFSGRIVCLQMKSRHFVCFFWLFVLSWDHHRGRDLAESSWEQDS